MLHVRARTHCKKSVTAAPEAPSQAGGFRETERSDLDTRGEKMAALRQAPSGDTSLCCEGIKYGITPVILHESRK